MKHGIHSFWPIAVITLLAGAAALAVAQPLLDPMSGDGTSATQATPPDAPCLTAEQRAAVRERVQHRRGRMELRHQGLEFVDSVYEVSTDPARAAILHMQRIERIYREQRDLQGLEGFYRDVLDRTDNLAIRNIAWLKLSELSTRAKDVSGALALLQQGLEENLRQAD